MPSRCSTAATRRRGWPAASRVFEGEIEFAGQEHFYLETHCSLAQVDEGGQVFVQSSTQHPTETQEIVAHVLGVPSHAVTVQCLRMGGGFGGKEMQPHGLAAIAALGATLTGRPVRLRLTRNQDITMTGKRHGFHATWRVGFDDDGLFTGLEATLTSDGGWSLDLSEPVLSRALCHVENAYWIPDIRVQGRIAQDQQDVADRVPRVRRAAGDARRSRTSSAAARRCSGSTPSTCAGATSTSRGRRRRTASPYATPSGPWPRGSRCSESSDFAARQAEVAAYNETHEHTKRGLAITPVKFGISFNFTAFNQAGALVHVYKDGSVLINHGGTEMGQGLHTKMLQVAATALGLPLEQVRLAPTRTDKVPNTSATAASAGADLNGGAVKNACEQIIERLAPLRAEAPRAVVGGARRRGPTTQRIQLWAAGFYKTEGLSWDLKTMSGSPFKYFAYGVAAAEVEVDGFTGAYVTRRVDIVHDVGDSLSPLVDLGQIEGGFVQGAGWLTLEDLRWDESDGPHRGRLTTQAASTYKLPSFSEMPTDFRVSLLERAHEDGAVYGSKAVGEPPLMLAFSVREALRQAAAAFGPPGTSVELASPATPEAVYWALDRARRRGSTRASLSTSTPGAHPMTTWWQAVEPPAARPRARRTRHAHRRPRARSSRGRRQDGRRRRDRPGARSAAATSRRRPSRRAREAAGRRRDRVPRRSSPPLRQGAGPAWRAVLRW